MGLVHRTLDGYGDCMEASPEVNQMAWARSVDLDLNVDRLLIWPTKFSFGAVARILRNRQAQFVISQN